MEPNPVSEAIEEVAIIGMACRFPGAPNLDTFWQNLKDGVESRTEFTDEELLAAGVPLATINGPDYVKAGFVLDQVEDFDAAFFDFSPRQAQLTDPQQRLFLETSWQALEQANIDVTRVAGAVGVYAGTGISTYLLEYYAALSALDSSPNYLQRLIGNEKDYLATQTAYKLNLRGPCVSVQTACSTGLVVVHMAAQSLLNYECDLALAGAVCINVPQKRGYMYHDGAIFSPDGHTRAFDADAAGTAFGSGVGVVILKRLREALADGDQIWAVIKGSAVNNDGAQKVGFTAPSIEGQTQVIAEALAVADLNPSTISYVEAHGTATPIGDPIEVKALTSIFAPTSRGPQTCAIGTVKSNVGHLGPASGIAGLIKTALALHHQALPASLHYTSPNPEIDFDQGPFYVNRHYVAWQTDQLPRRAGVSSFGIGGTNAHVVLEEGKSENTDPAANRADEETRWHLLTLSAKSEAALTALSSRYREFLLAAPDANLVDICYTSHVGRAHFDYRLALVGDSTADIAAKLAPFPRELATTNDDLREEPHPGPLLGVGFLPPPNLPHTGEGTVGSSTRQWLPPQPGDGSPLGAGGVSKYLPLKGEESELPPIPLTVQQPIVTKIPATSPKVAFLFTGQGAQYLQMGRILYETEARFRAIIDRCDVVLQEVLGRSLLELLYPETPPEHDDLMVSHPCGQAANFAIECALAELWRAWGVEPDALLGHSLGDFAAAYTAGVLTLEDGLRLVVQRGRLMENAVGSMVSILASEAAVAPFLVGVDDVTIAAINSPENVVISGGHASVAKITAACVAAGLKTRTLAIPVAAHSPLLDPVLDQFGAAVQKVNLSAPRCTVVSSMTGKAVHDELTDPGYWQRHLRDTVRFADGIATLRELGCTIFVEIGPQSTLLAMAEQVFGHEVAANADGHPPVLGCFPCLEETQNDRQRMLTTTGELYQAGVAIDWAGLHQHHQPRKVNLPTYAFQRQRYWVDGAPTVVAQTESTAQGAADEEELLQWRTSLVAMPSAQRVATLTTYLQQQIAATLGMAISEAALEQSLIALGLSSLIGIGLRNQLQRTLGIAIPITKFLDDTSIVQLAVFVDQALQEAGEQDEAIDDGETPDDREVPRRQQRVKRVKVTL